MGLVRRSDHDLPSVSTDDAHGADPYDADTKVSPMSKARVLQMMAAASRSKHESGMRPRVVVPPAKPPSVRPSIRRIATAPVPSFATEDDDEAPTLLDERFRRLATPPLPEPVANAAPHGIVTSLVEEILAAQSDDEWFEIVALPDELGPTFPPPPAAPKVESGVVEIDRRLAARPATKPLPWILRDFTLCVLLGMGAVTWAAALILWWLLR